MTLSVSDAVNAYKLAEDQFNSLNRAMLNAIEQGVLDGKATIVQRAIAIGNDLQTVRPTVLELQVAADKLGNAWSIKADDVVAKCRGIREQLHQLGGQFSLETNKPNPVPKPKKPPAKKTAGFWAGLGAGGLAGLGAGGLSVATVGVLGFGLYYLLRKVR